MNTFGRLATLVLLMALCGGAHASGIDKGPYLMTPTETSITYLVTGGGGAPLYDVTADTPYVKKALMVHHHCEFSVDGNTISVRAIQPDGALIEQFTLHANPVTAQR